MDDGTLFAPVAPAQGQTLGNLPEFTVSELSARLKRTVEDAFPFVRVRGEISRVTRNANGNCYFDLKDENAVLAAVVWKLGWARLKIKPEQGLDVVCTGRLTTYQGQSRYQLVVERIELAGIGALMAMIEERRKRLAAEGLFDAARKRPLPYLPDVIGVVTSPTGAVLRDIMHRLMDRFPRRVILWPVMVQGERAAAEITAAIRGFDALMVGGRIPRPDVIIVARGGGSVEDLLAFSEEIVLRAVADCTIPIISAVGHETDTTLIDFVSDRRAPTPSAGAEMAVPVRRELSESVAGFGERLSHTVERLFGDRRRTLVALARALPRADSLFALPRQRYDASAERLKSALGQNLQRHAVRLSRSGALLRPRIVADAIGRHGKAIDGLGNRLDRAYRARIGLGARQLHACARVLDSVSYRAVLERGFALVRGARGELRRRAAEIAPGEKLQLVFADAEARVTADGKTAVRRGPPKPGQGELF